MATARRARRKLKAIGARLGRRNRIRVAKRKPAPALSECPDADLEDFKVSFHEFGTRAARMAGTAREQAKAAISELGGSWDRLAARVAEVREASGEQWRERKKDVDAARVKLEQKLDETSKRSG